MTHPDEDLTPGDHLTPDERDIEAPEADASEQAKTVGPDDRVEIPLSRGLEVDEADAYDQSREVDFDDEYRP